ncbi:hypothetical protein D3C81_2035590 [compost metagenome]
MCAPTKPIMVFGSNDSTGSVTSDWARIATSVRRPCFLANAGEQMIAAAAPQVGGHAIMRVITPSHINWSFITSSVLTIFLNKASGLLAA